MRRRSKLSRGCGRKLDKVEGARQFLQAAQDVRLGGRATRTQFEYTLQDADLDELNAWAPKVLKKLQTLPQLRDVATDQQTSGTTLTLTIDRDAASRYGITAAAHRRHALRRLRPAAGRAVLHAAQQLSRDPGDPARAAGQASTRWTRSTSSRRLTGEQVPLSAFAKWTTVPVAAAVDQPSGPVPRHHHQLQPRARRGAGTGDRRHTECNARTRYARHRSTAASRAPRRRSSSRSAPCRC